MMKFTVLLLLGVVTLSGQSKPKKPELTVEKNNTITIPWTSIGSVSNDYKQSTLGPYSASSNLTVDLNGQHDTRPGTWGTADYAINKIIFKPPTGFRVRILKVVGDLTSFPKPNPGGLAYGSAGVLWGLSTTAAEGSVRADFIADNTMLYIQDALTHSDAKRAPISLNTSYNGLLAADHTLISKMAVYLNTIGVIHMEATFTLTYQFELQ